VFFSPPIDHLVPVADLVGLSASIPLLTTSLSGNAVGAADEYGGFTVSSHVKPPESENTLFWRMQHPGGPAADADCGLGWQPAPAGVWTARIGISAISGNSISPASHVRS
jgi:hypothetical protein